MSIITLLRIGMPRICAHCRTILPPVDEQRAWLSRELSTAPGAHWQGTDLVLASVIAREWFLERVALALVDERIGAVRQRLGSA